MEQFVINDAASVWGTLLLFLIIGIIGYFVGDTTSWK